MILNKNITVINEIDGVYVGTVIDGVSFIGKTECTVTDKGLVTADYYTLRIPETKGVTVVDVIQELGRPFLQTENEKILQTESGEAIEIYSIGQSLALVPQKTFIAVGRMSVGEFSNITRVLTEREIFRVISIKDNRNGHTLRHWRCDCK